MVSRFRKNGCRKVTHTICLVHSQRRLIHWKHILPSKYTRCSPLIQKVYYDVSVTWQVYDVGVDRSLSYEAPHKNSYVTQEVGQDSCSVVLQQEILVVNPIVC